MSGAQKSDLHRREGRERVRHGRVGRERVRHGGVRRERVRRERVRHGELDAEEWVQNSGPGKSGAWSTHGNHYQGGGGLSLCDQHVLPPRDHICSRPLPPPPGRGDGVGRRAGTDGVIGM